MSRISVISSPAPCSARIAVSLPAPGPLTMTSIWRIPWSIARRAALSAAVWAAKGVPFFAPLNPLDPALAQEITSPF